MDYSAIGSRIRKIRQSMGMSQEQLSESVGISTTHMSHIETGNTKLSLPVLVDIANVLNVSTDELLCGSLTSSKQVYVGEIADLLDNCSTGQIRVITDVVRTVKESLDKNIQP